MRPASAPLKLPKIIGYIIRLAVLEYQGLTARLATGIVFAYPLVFSIYAGPSRFSWITTAFS